jgi:membrane protease YdiL (CAAX protease family)
MPAVIVAAGILGLAAMWRLIAARRIGFWPGTSIAFAIVGTAAVFARPPGTFDAFALLAGAGSGIVLYAATRVAVGLLAPVAPFAASVTDVYRRSDEVPWPAVWLLTLVIAVPGEELFWRGLVLPELQEATSLVAGAVLAWIGYVLVNAMSRNVAILIAAVACGGWWTILASFEHVVAAVTSHLAWTGLMLAWPPALHRAKVTG